MTVIPGRAARREPGIQAFLAPPPGFRVRVLRTRPGMTVRINAAWYYTVMKMIAGALPVVNAGRWRWAAWKAKIIFERRSAH
jgi:hypothetical protein